METLNYDLTIEISKIIEVEFTELKKQLPNMKFKDFENYIHNVIIKNNKVRDITDAAFFIFNIKINKLIEYLNVQAVLDKSSSIKDDLNSILEG